MFTTWSNFILFSPVSPSLSFQYLQYLWVIEKLMFCLYLILTKITQLSQFPNTYQMFNSPFLSIVASRYLAQDATNTTQPFLSAHMWIQALADKKISVVPIIVS